MTNQFKKSFSTKLLNWYDQNSRALPWRENSDPYKIWISEIMLQQTQVATVIPYFNRFLQSFPTIFDLAKATQEEVLSLWSGLGYYKRGIRLIECAKIVVEKHNGIIPDDEKSLLALPGIGEYTSGAILSIAFNKPYPCVDGNIKRIISRVFTITENIENKKVKDQIKNLAKELIPENRARYFNQALMDLGATICIPKSNTMDFCEKCPVKSLCQGYKKGIVLQLPVLPQRRKKEIVFQLGIIFSYEDKFLITLRQNETVLNDMWEIPSETVTKDQTQLDKVLDLLKEKYNVTSDQVTYLFTINHAITYRDIKYYTYKVDVKDKKALEKMIDTPHKWIDSRKVSQYPHSSILKKIIRKLK